MNQVATSISASPEETRQYGRDLAARLRPGMVVALDGPLGAGKTHLLQGLAEGLGYQGDVTSPTFTLVHEYSGRDFPLYHLDFYRLDFADEVIALGWDEFLDSGGIVAVEWASKFPELLPPDTLWLNLTPHPHSPDEREIRVFSSLPV